MRYADFEANSSGVLVPTVYKSRAFHPNPLPPKISLDDIADELMHARGAIGELRGACRRLPNPYMLIRPLQRLEAQTSSAMEGTFTTADALALAEAGVEQSNDAREVANYTRALSWAIDQLEEFPISNRLIRGAHKRLMSGVGRQRGEDKLPGEFKRDQNMIGGSRIETARFIPPPPAEAVTAMSDLEKYINRSAKREAWCLIDLALVHYQFETIHPFADGNGRVGRMLISLQAITEGLMDKPAIYMSPELEARKDEYIDKMYNVSSRSDWGSWIRFFLEILSASCERATNTIDRILELQTHYQTIATEHSRSSNMVAAVNLLFESPVVRAKDLVQALSITDASARNLIAQLAGVGIVEELRDYYPKCWAARELIEVSSPQYE